MEHIAVVKSVGLSMGSALLSQGIQFASHRGSTREWHVMRLLTIGQEHKSPHDGI